MSIIVLSLVFVFSLALVGGKRGVKTLFTLLLNILVFALMAKCMLSNINPILCAIVACMVICVITLFLNCGINVKSISSFICVTVVVLLLWLVVELFGRGARIEGFSFQKLSEIAGYSWVINISMADISIACILIGLIGAITDTSVAISSAAFEIYDNNRDISFIELFRSGMNVGKDILGTTCNTLFYAFLGGYMTLFIMFSLYSYSLSTIINSAVFVEEFLRVMISMSGCVIIIPITSLFTSLFLKTRLNKFILIVDNKKQKFSDYINAEEEN